MDTERSGPFLVLIHLECRINRASWLISYRCGGEGGIKTDSDLHNWGLVMPVIGTEITREGTVWRLLSSGLAM